MGLNPQIKIFLSRIRDISWSDFMSIGTYRSESVAVGGAVEAVPYDIATTGISPKNIVFRML